MDALWVVNLEFRIYFCSLPEKDGWSEGMVVFVLEVEEEIAVKVDLEDQMGLNGDQRGRGGGDGWMETEVKVEEEMGVDGDRGQGGGGDGVDGDRGQGGGGDGWMETEVKVVEEMGGWRPRSRWRRRWGWMETEVKVVEERGWMETDVEMGVDGDRCGDGGGWRPRWRW